MKHDKKTNTATQIGIGYYVQGGFVLTDAGTKVKLFIVTDENVYNGVKKLDLKKMEFQSHVIADKTSSVKDPFGVEYDATTNCTGYCFLGGKVVLSATEVTKKNETRRVF